MDFAAEEGLSLAGSCLESIRTQFHNYSARCHSERSGSQARDITPADAVDGVDGNARASCSAGAPRICTTGVWAS
jgi:hypothetical protein